MSRPETCKVVVKFGDPGAAPPAAPRTRVDIEPGKVEQGLLKLVLTLVELIRQLMEKQAIRRIEAGTLTDPEIDRLGTTLMQLEDKIKELQEQFEIDELNINLGPLGNLL
jgi:hypothetical protein